MLLEDHDVIDFLARRLYDMTAEIIMCLLIIDDITRATAEGNTALADTFQKSANVYVRMSEEDVIGKSAYIKNFNQDDLASFKAAEAKAEE